jgi:hypothetical protein
MLNERQRHVSREDGAATWTRIGMPSGEVPQIDANKRRSSNERGQPRGPSFRSKSVRIEASGSQAAGHWLSVQSSDVKHRMIASR